MSPEKFVHTVRTTFGTYPDFSGGCLKFHIILSLVYADARGYYDGGHVITRIGDSFWDIEGEWKKGLDGFMPIGYGLENGYSARDLIVQFQKFLSHAEIDFLLKKYGV